MSNTSGQGYPPGAEVPRSSISIRELAERTGLSEQEVERTLDDLAAAGYDMRAPEGGGTFVVPFLPPRPEGGH